MIDFTDGKNYSPLMDSADGTPDDNPLMDSKDGVSGRFMWDSVDGTPPDNPLMDSKDGKPDRPMLDVAFLLRQGRGGR